MMNIKQKILILVFSMLTIITFFLTIRAVDSINTMANINIKQYERQVILAKKEALKNYVDMAKNILQTYQDQVTSTTTKMELQVIQGNAIKAMNTMVYGDNNGYIFIWTYDGVPLAFTPRPELLGQKLLDLKGGNGKFVIKDHIANAKKGGSHFYTYKWRTTKDSPYQTKISYSFGIQDWGWFVGTGAYMGKEEKQIEKKKHNLELNTNTLIQDIILDTIIFMIFVGIGFYLILYNIINKPLQNLQNGLNNFFLFLKNKTTKIQHIQIISNDEIGSMTKSINDNIDVSVKLHKEIHELNLNLEHKVQTAIKKIRKQDQQLIQQSRLVQMGEMISMIAHQWRQPLNAINLTSSNLIFKCMTNKIDNRFLKNELELIDHYAQDLSKTIDNFSGLFKNSREKEITTLEGIAIDTINIVEKSFKSNNITLVTVFDCNKKLFIFQNELKQVVLNILTNAKEAFIQNNIAEPTIIVKTVHDNNFNILTIKNNAGIISKDIIHRIFDPYFSTKEQKDGAGLGLYMSKIIVEDHFNGQLTVENTNEGVMFTIKLENTILI